MHLHNHNHILIRSFASQCRHSPLCTYTDIAKVTWIKCKKIETEIRPGKGILVSNYSVCNKCAPWAAGYTIFMLMIYISVVRFGYRDAGYPKVRKVKAAKARS